MKSEKVGEVADLFLHPVNDAAQDRWPCHADICNIDWASCGFLQVLKLLLERFSRLRGVDVGFIQDLRHSRPHRVQIVKATYGEAVPSNVGYDRLGWHISKCSQAGERIEIYFGDLDLSDPTYEH